MSSLIYKTVLSCTCHVIFIACSTIYIDVISFLFLRVIYLIIMVMFINEMLIISCLYVNTCGYFTLHHTLHHAGG